MQSTINRKFGGGNPLSWLVADRIHSPTPHSLLQIDCGERRKISKTMHFDTFRGLSEVAARPQPDHEH